MRTYCFYGILIYLAAINIAAFFLYGILFLHLAAVLAAGYYYYYFAN